jgi:hypothetical protein
MWTSHIRIIAANGDEISGSMSGTATFISAHGDYLWFAEPVHFTEGTGRFANVVLDGAWHGGGNVFTKTVWGVLEGTLRYAARDAARR